MIPSHPDHHDQPGSSFGLNQSSSRQLNHNSMRAGAAVGRENCSQNQTKNFLIVKYAVATTIENKMPTQLTMKSLIVAPK